MHIAYCRIGRCITCLRFSVALPLQIDFLTSFCSVFVLLVQLIRRTKSVCGSSECLGPSGPHVLLEMCLPEGVREMLLR